MPETKVSYTESPDKKEGKRTIKVSISKDGLLLDIRPLYTGSCDKFKKIAIEISTKSCYSGRNVN